MTNDVKKYKTSEVAEMIGITKGRVNYVVNKYHIDFELAKADGHRCALFTKEAIEQIKAHKVDKFVKPVIPVKEVIEDENKHPLVTDKRCLSLSYWPDVIPDCFKDVEL